MFEKIFETLTARGERRGVRRPGSGPATVYFSRAEIRALSKYTVGYPLEEATEGEQTAFESGLAKIRERAERLEQDRRNPR